MNEHPEFEFVIDESEESICGVSVSDVFQKLPETFIGKEGDFADRILKCLASNGIQDDIGEITETEEFLERFFNLLQKKLVGTWRWYDNSLGKCWLLDFKTNTPKKNRRFWRWKGKTWTPEHKAKFIAAVKAGNERFNKSEAKAERDKKAKKKFNAFIKKMTSEERKAFYSERSKKSFETRRRKQNDNAAK